MIGQVVFYKTKEAPQRFYPAIVSGRHPALKWWLTVFPEGAPTFTVCAAEQPDTPGSFQKAHPYTAAETPAETEDLLILLISPHEDPLAVLGSHSKLAEAKTVVAVEPDGSHVVVKDRDGGLSVSVKRGSKRLAAVNFARSFVERVKLDEDLEAKLTDWFECAMNGEAP